MEPALIQKNFRTVLYHQRNSVQRTGLGLATVYAVVKQHHGWIVLMQSEVGAGTTANVFLPASDQAAAAAPAVPTPQPESVPGGKETILFAEDEGALLELMRHVLGQYHYNILTRRHRGARSALEVWDKHQWQVDLLLTDMVMPGGMTGRELATELKKKKPGLKVILTSGYNSTMAGKDCSKGDTVFLPKPYLPDEAAKLIRSTLDASQASRPTA